MHPEIVMEDFPGYAPEDTQEPHSRLWSELSTLRKRPDLLASFIRHACRNPAPIVIAVPFAMLNSVGAQTDKGGRSLPLRKPLI